MLQGDAARRRGSIGKLRRLVKERQQRKSGAVTIYDVAARANVSIKTVSRVINGEPNVREETADRVRLAARELYYRPNLSARSLRAERSFQVALWHGLYGGGISSYYTTIQNSFVRICTEMGFGAVLDPIDLAEKRIIRSAIASLAEKRPCGVVMTPPFSDNEELLLQLEGTKTAFVCVSPAIEYADRPFVTTDDLESARAMTDYLIDYGHRRIGFISGDPDHGAAARRVVGYRAALRVRGIPIDDRLVTTGGFNFESGAESARKLLSLRERPTAIFAANDDMAAGVVYIAHDLGLRVPDDLSVAGFDDTAIARYIHPGITTIHQPIREMTRTAIEYLVIRARQPDGGEMDLLARRIPCRLVIRESVGPPKGQ